MQPGKRDPRKILRPLDMPDTRRARRRDKRTKRLQMPDIPAPAFRGPIGLVHHRQGVAEELRVDQADLPRKAHRLDQREPFGIHASPRSKIPPDKRLTADHDRGRHAARPTPAIEEDFYAR